MRQIQIWQCDQILRYPEGGSWPKPEPPTRLAYPEGGSWPKPEPGEPPTLAFLEGGIRRFAGSVLNNAAAPREEACTLDKF